LTQALGINKTHNGINLLGHVIWIEDDGIEVSNHAIKNTQRIGVDYAGKDAKLPYRFILDDVFLRELIS
jgi:DNA-3-methyladenine glycosylase